MRPFLLLCLTHPGKLPFFLFPVLDRNAFVHLLLPGERFGRHSLHIQCDLVAHDFETLVHGVIVQGVIVAAQLAVIAYVTPVLFQKLDLGV